MLKFKAFLLKEKLYRICLIVILKLKDYLFFQEEIQHEQIFFPKKAKAWNYLEI